MVAGAGRDAHTTNTRPDARGAGATYAFCAALLLYESRKRLPENDFEHRSHTHTHNICERGTTVGAGAEAGLGEI